MKKIRNLLIGLYILFAAFSVCAYAADQAALVPPPPTQKDILLAQRATILERMDKLDAQYQLAHAQYILAKQDLDSIEARIRELLASEKKAGKPAEEKKAKP